MIVTHSSAHEQDVYTPSTLQTGHSGIAGRARSSEKVKERAASSTTPLSTPAKKLPLSQSKRSATTVLSHLSESLNKMTEESNKRLKERDEAKAEILRENVSANKTFWTLTLAEIEVNAKIQ
ncbi:hypothetical protein RUND412_011218, partial [Rhizina undulata]